MEKEIGIDADLSVDIGGGIVQQGVIQHLTFNPSKEFGDDEGEKLFGITVRQQGRKLIIITKIYNEKRRKEIIDKFRILIKLMITTMGDKEIDKIHIVDAKDMLDQMSKYKITAEKFDKYMKQKQDITVEIIDLITGEYVPVEFSVGKVIIDKRKNQK